MSIITPITGGAGVVPLGALARGHHTVKARALAGEAGEFAGGWAETDLYLPEDIFPDATLDLLFQSDWKTYSEPAGLGRGGVFSTPGAAFAISRPSGRGRRTSLGVFETLADNQIARDHDDAGTALGLQIEPQATYTRVNSSLTGLVVGSPGTAPDGWSIPAPAGLTRTLSLVTASGRPKLRVHYAGAPSSNFQFLLQTIPSLTLAASPGQIWTYGARFSCQGTGLDGNSLALSHWETDNANAILRSGAVGGTSPLAHARRSTTVTIGASTTYIRLLLGSGVITAGTTCDFWIDIEAPQLTQTAFLPSEYLVGTSSAVRYADNISTTWGAWGNQAAGSFRAVYTAPYAAAPVGDVLSVTNVDGSAQMVLRARTGAANIAWFVTSGGVEVGRIEAGAAVSGQREVLACSYGPAGFKISRNGGAVAANGALSPIASPAALLIGRQFFDGNQLGGWMERLSFKPSQLSNSDLQAWAAAA